MGLATGPSPPGLDETAPGCHIPGRAPGAGCPAAARGMRGEGPDGDLGHQIDDLAPG